MCESSRAASEKLTEKPEEKRFGGAVEGSVSLVISGWSDARAGRRSLCSQTHAADTTQRRREDARSDRGGGRVGAIRVRRARFKASWE